MKCVARLWLPLSAKQSEGRRARWQPALLCWSKRKLLLLGDRRQRWSVASPFPRQSALRTWLLKPTRWVIRFLDFVSLSVCFLTLMCCAENVKFSVMFGHTQRHAVTWPLRTTAHGWFLSSSSYCCYLQSNWARSASACLLTSSSLVPTRLWYAWNLGAFCLTTGCDSLQPPVRQCGLIEQALEFLSWSPLVVFIPLPPPRQSVMFRLYTV